MPRRGWLPAPDGWVQIIRGPRPPSMKWPSATEMRQTFNTVKKEGDGGLQRSQARGRWRQLPARVSPEVSHEAAQKRVAQLEGALKAFGDATGPEVTILQESLKSAKRAAQVPPLTVQVSQCEQFIARAQKRLVAHDEERILLVKQLEDGQQRSAQPPRASFQVGRTSSPATRLGSPGSEPPTNGERFAIKAGRIGGADPCREDRFVATSRASGNRSREEHSCNADFDSGRALSVDGRPTGGFTECFLPTETTFKSSN